MSQPPEGRAEARKALGQPSQPEIIESPYPFQRLLGFQIVDWRADLVEIHQPLHAALGNRFGIPHGGVHATLLDTAMGFAGCFTGDPAQKIQAMTLSLTTTYLARPKGRMLIARGRRTGGGRRIFFAEGEILDDTGELIARGSGTFRFRGDGGAGSGTRDG